MQTTSRSKAFRQPESLTVISRHRRVGNLLPTDKLRRTSVDLVDDKGNEFNAPLFMLRKYFD
ncbi:MAG: hypothetical protein IJ881_04185 [Neisseriaceae bacterium]|nr:hypothetical protein [Neisseriaceae bacterium]MBR3425866.1 hypothetical protein [Neisseriaceae bacterium]